jgi:hypothetical protein
MLNQDRTIWPRAAVDSDIGNDVDESKSVTGYVVFINGIVSWKSKRQPIVATSTCYAEYIATSEVARELAWIRMLLIEIGFKLSRASPVLEDNAAAYHKE